MEALALDGRRDRPVVLGAVDDRQLLPKRHARRRDELKRRLDAGRRARPRQIVQAHVEWRDQQQLRRVLTGLLGHEAQRQLVSVSGRSRWRCTGILAFRRGRARAGHRAGRGLVAAAAPLLVVDEFDRRLAREGGGTVGELQLHRPTEHRLLAPNLAHALLFALRTIEHHLARLLHLWVPEGQLDLATCSRVGL